MLNGAGTETSKRGHYPAPPHLQLIPINKNTQTHFILESSCRVRPEPVLRNDRPCSVRNWHHTKQNTAVRLFFVARTDVSTQVVQIVVGDRMIVEHHLPLRRSVGERCENASFEPFVYKNAIILPRQARDKHRESTQKRERRFPHLRRVVEALNQRHARALAAAGLADKRHLSARLDNEAEAVEHLRRNIGQQKTHARYFFLNFPYVCPEPVMVKCSFLYTNGSKTLRSA
jgi:hypothetical protein